MVKIKKMSRTIPKATVDSEPSELTKTPPASSNKEKVTKSRYIPKYEQKFTQSWLSDPNLSSWLVEQPKNVSFCKVCNEYFRAALGKKILIAHSRSKKHKRNASNIKYEDCRICMKPNDIRYMPSIFEKDQLTNLEVCAKITLCSGIQIPDGSKPDKICTECAKSLHASYKFQLLCKKSEKYYRHLIDPLITQTLVENEDELKNEPLTPEPVPEAQGIEIETSEEVAEETLSPTNNDRVHRTAKAKSKTETEVYKLTCAPSELETATNIDKIVCIESDASAGEPQFIDQDSCTSDGPESIAIPDIEFKVLRHATEKKPKTFICDICGNVYSKMFKLKDHMRRHNNDKPFDCEICKKKFSHSSGLRNHIRTHTGETPFHCSYCDRRFSDYSTRTRHERTHTNEKPYSCEICGKKFAYACSVKKHQLVHTGDKPYICLPCNKGFGESHHLKTHQKTVIHQQNLAKMMIVKSSEEPAISVVKCKDESDTSFTYSIQFK